MRQSIDQVDLEPKVHLISIEGDERLIKTRAIKLTIEPAEDVFALDLAKKKEDSKFAEELGELVETLKGKSKRPDYKQTVDLLMKKTNIPLPVVDKVNEVWGKIIDG